MKRTICAVITARASYARIKSALAAIRDHPDLTLRIVVAGSAVLERYGDIRAQMHADGFEIAAWTTFIVEGENLVSSVKSTGLGLIEMGTVLDRMAPDAVISVADRYETLATAVAASYMNIRLAHTQGGELTGSIDESVRHAITRLAHIHFPATEQARERLIDMGEDPESVFWVGCPSLDLIPSTDLSLNGLFDRYTGVGAPVDPSKPYLVVVQHSVTTEYGQAWDQVWETLRAIARLRMQTVWLWPNVDAGSDDISKGLRVFREQHKPEYIHFYRNFAPEDYLKLINNCACLVGNSSSAIREGAFLGVPAVNVGTRQQGRERGPNVVDVGYDEEEILKAIKQQMEHGKYPSDHTYGDGHAGERIARVLAEYEPAVQKRLYMGRWSSWSHQQAAATFWG